MMNSLKTLGLAVALTASAAGSVLAQAQTVQFTAAPANFQGDSSGGTYAVGETGPGSSMTYMDIEGTGPKNGSKTDPNRYDTFGVVDFTGNSVYNANGNQETIASVDPNITLTLTDASYSQSRPGNFNFYLSESNPAPSSLKYQISDTSATAGVGSQLGSLIFLGTGYDAAQGATNVGSLLSYNLTLPAAAQSYLIQQLNADYNPLPGDPTPVNLTNLRFVITAADSGTSEVGAFSGATGSGAPTLTFNANPVPEASTTVSFGLLLALGAGGFAVARRRRA